ncbi:hypothetical protein SLS58_010802 [Diplodia intermedia]|uniref:FAD-binding PCMH-type domain-containing protein n=1 Tax=Diplodia intermedia TaxID=856260 RepID=A0ABR3T3I4_9PEZI
MAAISPALAFRSLLVLPLLSLLGCAAQAQFFAIPSVRDCATLAIQFGSQLHYPEADGNFTVWDAKQLASHRACRIEPATAKEVAAVLGILASNWCKFAVKSGGHTSSRDASNSVGGVTVDLKRINQVELSDCKTQTRVGTGAIWGDVYRTLEPQELSVIGGRVDDVGVGGLAMGGGVSFLSARHGWALDNILEYEIVLPNTTIVTASEDSNPDLYFALRGGGNNFGIVTHFTLNTVRQGKIYGGQKFYTPDKMDALIDASYELTFSTNPDIGYWIGYIYMADKNATLALSQEMYARPEKNPTVYSNFDKVEPMGNSMRTSVMSDFSMELKHGTPAGKRNYMASLTFLPSKEQDRRMIQFFQEEIEILKTEGKTATPALTFQPVPLSSIRNMKVRGGNAIGLESDSPLTLANVATSWTNAEEDDAIYASRERFLARSRASAQELGVFHKYVYMNYADSERDDVFSGYDEQNVERLKEIQRSVDPEGVFTRDGLCTGYFKLI